MNLAWAEGVTTAMDSRLRPELASKPGYCCVVFQQALGSPGTEARELNQRSPEADKE